MGVTEGFNYDNDPNYQAFLEEQAPPWREDWTTTRPTLVPGTLTADEQRSLIETNIGMVDVQIRRLRAKGITIDDEEAQLDGAEGLCDAARRYDTNMGSKFTSYAPHRVSGAIVDGVRRFNKLSGEKRTAATVVSQLNNTRAISLFMAVLALGHGEEVALVDTIPADQPSTEDLVESEDAVLTVHTAIHNLEPRQRDIILRKLRGLGHEAIASDLGVSSRTVSRDVHRAYTVLRELLYPQLFD